MLLNLIYKPEFNILNINDSIYSRIKEKSYREGCPIPLDELRYLTLPYFDLNGNEHCGELICNKYIATDVISIFQELYKMRYPFGSIMLIDIYDANDEISIAHNNTSCFNYRTIAGTSRLSKHAYGLAIDINPLYNPWIDNGIVQPACATQYADRRRSFPFKINHSDICCQLFMQYGFRWGGDWETPKDYQHFEKEI